ncbi:PREDICTED: uncharacterized protein LOC109592809 [Amphimedon queenslandica]|uniref:Uncharacterized protein n=2 Tax=Amphimedon queenslandica TaxID=400682 RepID=A0AAN0K3H5_AMPQE|nr:PREDICTED: uncharacterized protein LOC109592809 [Amphimedon queenslandica]|eukprot:XP_019863723.1 PREDICTED: uncharacterized protein LOC109592809 [Amphimedon queenslandica]
MCCACATQYCACALIFTSPVTTQWKRVEMSLRKLIKDTQKKTNPSYFLKYFKQDDTYSIVKANCVEVEQLEAGTSCRVRDGKDFHDGTIVTFGDKKDVSNAAGDIIEKIENESAENMEKESAKNMEKQSAESMKNESDYKAWHNKKES